MHKVGRTIIAIAFAGILLVPLALAQPASTARAKASSSPMDNVIATLWAGKTFDQTAISPDGKYVLVSSEIGGTVSVIDVATKKIVKTIGFAIPGVDKPTIQAVGVNITADGKTAFVALGPANRVAVIDLSNFEVTKYLLVGQRVWHMEFTPDGKYLVTANGNSNDISIIDVAALKVIKSVAVGQLPWGLVIR